MTDITSLSLRTIATKIKAREISPVEITQACIKRANETDDQINAFSNLLAEKAIVEAKIAENEIAQGHWRGELHGIPFGIKELFDVAGEPTTSGSQVRANWVAEKDAAAVSRLRNAGAIILGKTHTHEFAYGYLTPDARNPWDTDRIPGGSSGGSAAAVAVGSAVAALGSDTVGSIRIPSALCGTVGPKPTYGRCSRVGVTSLAWSLDHIGPLTRTVADAAVCLNALAGYDERDEGSLNAPTEDFTVGLGQGINNIRIGVPQNHFFDQIDGEVEASVRSGIELLSGAGATLVNVRIPHPEQYIAVASAICLPEASEYHRRMLRSTPDLYTPEVRGALERGEMIPATRYIQALRVRRTLQSEWAEMFRDVDIIAAPAVAFPAPAVGESAIDWGDGMVEPLTLAFARLAAPGSVLGLPTVTVPCGFTRSGLPISIQLIAKPLEERCAIQVGDAFQRLTDWHEKRPQLG